MLGDDIFILRSDDKAYSDDVLARLVDVDPDDVLTRLVDVDP
jgi:hypothetical protein